MIDRERFERALALANAPTPTCIGTLSERVTHRVLKYYFEPDPNFHEVKYLGSVADIKNSDGIIEIQTKGLDRLRGKLHKFLPTYVGSSAGLIRQAESLLLLAPHLARAGCPMD